MVMPPSGSLPAKPSTLPASQTPTVLARLSTGSGDQYPPAYDLPPPDRPIGIGLPGVSGPGNPGIPGIDVPIASIPVGVTPRSALPVSTPLSRSPGQVVPARPPVSASLDSLVSASTQTRALVSGCSPSAPSGELPDTLPLSSHVIDAHVLGAVVAERSFFIGDTPFHLSATAITTSSPTLAADLHADGSMLHLFSLKLLGNSHPLSGASAARAEFFNAAGASLGAALASLSDATGVPSIMHGIGVRTDQIR